MKLFNSFMQCFICIIILVSFCLVGVLSSESDETEHLTSLLLEPAGRIELDMNIIKRSPPTQGLSESSGIGISLGTNCRRVARKKIRKREIENTKIDSIRPSQLRRAMELASDYDNSEIIKATGYSETQLQKRAVTPKTPRAKPLPSKAPGTKPKAAGATETTAKPKATGTTGATGTKSKGPGEAGTTTVKPKAAEETGTTGTDPKAAGTTGTTAVKPKAAGATGITAVKPKAAEETGTTGTEPKAAGATGITAAKPKAAAAKPKAAGATEAKSEAAEEPGNIGAEPKAVGATGTTAAKPKAAAVKPKAPGTTGATEAKSKAAEETGTTGAASKGAGEAETIAVKPKAEVATGTTGENPKDVGANGTAEAKPKAVGATGTTEAKPKAAGATGATGVKPKAAGANGTAEANPKPAGANGTAEVNPKPVGATGTTGAKPKAVGANGTAEANAKVAGATRATGTKSKAAGANGTAEANSKAAVSTGATGTKPKAAGANGTAQGNAKSAGATGATGAKPKAVGANGTAEAKPKAAGTDGTTGAKPKGGAANLAAAKPSGGKPENKKELSIQKKGPLPNNTTATNANIGSTVESPLSKPPKPADTKKGKTKRKPKKRPKKKRKKQKPRPCRRQGKGGRTYPCYKKKVSTPLPSPPSDETGDNRTTVGAGGGDHDVVGTGDAEARRKRYTKFGYRFGPIFNNRIKRDFSEKKKAIPISKLRILTRKKRSNPTTSNENSSSNRFGRGLDEPFEDGTTEQSTDYEEEPEKRSKIQKKSDKAKSPLISTVKPPVKPTVKPTVKSAVKPTVKPTVKSAVKPTVKSAVKPTVISAVKPAVKPTVKPALKPTVTPAVKQTVKPPISVNLKENDLQITEAPPTVKPEKRKKKRPCRRQGKQGHTLPCYKKKPPISPPKSDASRRKRNTMLNTFLYSNRSNFSSENKSLNTEYWGDPDFHLINDTQSSSAYDSEVTELSKLNQLFLKDVNEGLNGSIIYGSTSDLSQWNVLKSNKNQREVEEAGTDIGENKFLSSEEFGRLRRRRRRRRSIPSPDEYESQQGKNAYPDSQVQGHRSKRQANFYLSKQDRKNPQLVALLEEWKDLARQGLSGWKKIFERASRINFPPVIEEENRAQIDVLPEDIALNPQPIESVADWLKDFESRRSAEFQRSPAKITRKKRSSETKLFLYTSEIKQKLLKLHEESVNLVGSICNFEVSETKMMKNSFSYTMNTIATDWPVHIHVDFLENVSSLIEQINYCNKQAREEMSESEKKEMEFSISSVALSNLLFEDAEQGEPLKRTKRNGGSVGTDLLLSVDQLLRMEMFLIRILHTKCLVVNHDLLELTTNIIQRFIRERNLEPMNQIPYLNFNKLEVCAESQI